ncbi:MAG: copper-binding protein [Deltaproteobacteria bacterium]|nr:copper-binding protein [Deltaproteobacteria bacterium]
MTVQELIDLSAYMASLRPKGVPKLVSGIGKVIALVPESQQIVVDHEEIKGFMDAMTMGYKVSSNSLLKGLKPGDKIRFAIDTEKHAVTKIEKLKG